MIQPLSVGTTAERFGSASISERVRCRTLTMLSGRDGVRSPVSASIASLRTDVRPVVGKKKPIEHLYRIMLEAIGAGASFERVTLFLDEMKEDMRQAVARRDRAAAGVLPFRQQFIRHAVRGEREESEAHVAAMQMDEANLASLVLTRDELVQEIAADQETLACLNAEIVKRQGQG